MGQESKWEPLLRVTCLGILCMSRVAQAELGLIGGNASSAYAAYVAVPGGAVTAINGLPSGGIQSVALNLSGNGIIGGTNGLNGYAAFVNPTGSVNPLALSLPNGQVASVSINASGQALVGGINQSGFIPYAATVTPDGMVVSLSLTAASPGEIFSVALDDAGVGLIGGEGGDMAYAAYLSSMGIEIPLTLPSDTSSQIAMVAINSQGNGVIGGFVNSTAYGALTTSEQSNVTALTGLPTNTPSFLSSVDINDAGLVLVGGQGNNGNAFAGYANPGSAAVTLLPLGITGVIGSVAINSSGQGIIGGQNNSLLYAALVNPSGTVTPLITDTTLMGEIISVDIDEFGIGLIGGQSNGSSYAALVAPNGALTFLDVSSSNEIISVALDLAPLANAVTPTSIGFLNSVFFTQLAASSALEWRFLEHSKIGQRPSSTAVAQREGASSKELLAANTPLLGAYSKNPRFTTASARQPKAKNSIWISPFGDFLHFKGSGALPSVHNDIGGVLLAYDRQGRNFLIGGALGYAFNYLHYGSHQGHGKIHEEMATVYGSYSTDHFWFDVALWGGYYHFTNVRHAASIMTSKGKTHGWLFAPHFEMATPWAIGRQRLCYVEPFVALDWVKDWQHAFTESGPSGFNLKMPSLHGSLLQSEAGLRFYERFLYRWGQFLLEEKVSYVNQAPFFDKYVTTAFVSSPVGFPIAIGSTKVENLACLGLMGSWVPGNTSYPFAGFSAQATVNGTYQNYFVSLFTGWDF